MSNPRPLPAVRFILITAMLSAAPAPMPVSAQSPASLEALFEDPPSSARPRVWWHWMNGNITQDGIAKDMAWMKRVGIGGLQNFDAALTTPPIVPNRLVYMTAEWKKAFRFAAAEAERNGLELAIAASPGWSETGGPWVLPKDGMKKLVWSEVEVAGGQPFTSRLPAPSGVTGPFQGVEFDPGIAGAMGGKLYVPPSHYEDVAVLAVPIANEPEVAPATFTDSGGNALDGAALTDGDPKTTVQLPAEGAAIVVQYPSPQTIRSASLFMPRGAVMFFGSRFAPRLDVSEDGKTWRRVSAIIASEVPSTVSFAPVTAARFRVAFDPNPNVPPNPLGGAPGADDSFFAMLTRTPPTVAVGELRLSGSPRVNQFEAKAGFHIAPDYYTLDADAGPETKGVASSDVVNLTGKLQADGRLDWTPPAGRWRVIRLGASLTGKSNHPATPEATGLEVDKYDAKSVRRYLETYLDMYRDAAGPELFGKRGLRALLTDSIEVGASNWTPELISQFKRLRGYDPTPWLPALTGVIVGSRSESDRFLFDFRQTLGDLLASEHYGTVATVAHERGLIVYGEALEGGRPSLGDDIAIRSHADIPMAALWTWRPEAGPNIPYFADMKGAASTAHLYGRPFVAAESLTSGMAPWAHAPADLRRVIDLEFAYGINRPVIHTSVHQPVDDKLPGLSLMIFGQFFNRHETWAEMARPWIDYLSRNSLMLQQGRYFADVAYFYGEEAPLTGLYEHKPVADAPVHHGYDFIGKDALLGLLSVEGGDLSAKSGARYRVLYLGGTSRRMSLPVLRRIAAFAEAGATIVGRAPAASPGLGDDAGEYAALVGRLWGGRPTTAVGKGRVIESEDVEAALAAIGVAQDFRTDARRDSEILFLHRRLADGDAYFVNNRKARTETVEARFRVTGKEPELWRADTGKREPLSYRTEGAHTIVPLELGPEESLFVVFRNPATALSRTIPRRAWKPAGTLDNPWTVAFQPGRGAPLSPLALRSQSLADSQDPGIRYFSGVSTWTSTFDAPGEWKPGMPLRVDLGRVGDVAEVRVNGTLAGTAWKAPWTVEIGDAAKTGNNTIEVRVANLWVNRLIGDKQPGATPLAFVTIPTYKPEAPLRPSGLIGPVTLSVPME